MGSESTKSTADQHPFEGYKEKLGPNFLERRFSVRSQNGSCEHLSPGMNLNEDQTGVRQLRAEKVLGEQTPVCRPWERVEGGQTMVMMN